MSAASASGASGSRGEERGGIEAIGALRELFAMSISSPANAERPCCSAVGDMEY
jgi:hypothetical protein